MNNRKQKINAFLDSITEKELNDYVEKKKLNNDFAELLKKIKNHKPKNHFSKISNDVEKKISSSLGEYFKIGQAWVIAFVLECFYDNKYKIKDLKYYLKEMIKNDKQLKEYVYEIMKDF